MSEIDMQIDRLEERITAHENAWQQGVHEIGGPTAGAGWFVFDAVNTIKSDASGTVTKDVATVKTDIDSVDWRVLFHSEQARPNIQAAFFTWATLPKISGTWDEFDNFDTNIELYMHVRNITANFDPDTVTYSNKPATGSEVIIPSKFEVPVGGIAPQGGSATYDLDAAKFQDTSTPYWFVPFGTVFSAAGTTYGLEVRITATLFNQEGGTWSAEGGLNTSLTTDGTPIHAALQY